MRCTTCTLSHRSMTKARVVGIRGEILPCTMYRNILSDVRNHEGKSSNDVLFCFDFVFSLLVSSYPLKNPQIFNWIFV